MSATLPHLRGLRPTDAPAPAAGDAEDVLSPAMRRAWALYGLTGDLVRFDSDIADYWKHGEGAARIRWGTPGDWTRCKRFLTKHVGSERAKRMCAQWHHDVTGVWPGDKRNTG